MLLLCMSVGYVCVHVGMGVYMCVEAHTCLHTYTYTHMYMGVHKCVHVCKLEVEGSCCPQLLSILLRQGLSH